MGMPSAHAAQVPDPRSDPFYAVPADIGSSAPGAVLGSRVVSPALFGLIRARATGYQLRYRTTDNLGNPTATLTTVLVPNTPAPAAGKPRPVVSYQEAEDSNSLQCAPSYGLVAGAPVDNPVGQVEMLLIAGYLAKGDIVVVPDYEGPASLYTVGLMAGHATLDGIRAAKAFAPAGISASAPVGLVGYSGGALATEWAAQLQPSYAPDVKLSAVAAGGVPVNIGHMAPHIDASGFLDGIVQNGITGEAKAYPDLVAQASQYISPTGRAVMRAVNTECNQTVTATYAFVPYSTMFTVPDPLNSIPQMRQIISANTLGGATPAKVPTYIYESVNDEATVPADVDALVAQDCAAGVPINYQRDILSEHVVLAITGAFAATTWMQGTLTGQTRTTGCHTTTSASLLLTGPGAVGLLALLLGLPAVFG
ncbi:MAG: hypothetical protein JWQ77_43 [Jatrophihabitans sp.]|nr:hypothetical protein [Jatrophihabitans sp.]